MSHKTYHSSDVTNVAVHTGHHIKTAAVEHTVCITSHDEGNSTLQDDDHAQEMM